MFKKSLKTNLEIILRICKRFLDKKEIAPRITTIVLDLKTSKRIDREYVFYIFVFKVFIFTGILFLNLIFLTIKLHFLLFYYLNLLAPIIISPNFRTFSELLTIKARNYEYFK